MSKIERTKICKCENCGNEAEMVVTCSLDTEQSASPAAEAPQQKKVKGTATCSHCGSEADMWIDLE